MQRPHTVLWVDDEFESLAAHVLFLEEHGYVVERTPHGDDALALLRRQPYGVVLLDEQLPGRRGRELVGEIRAIDPSIPLVMVAKSEGAATRREGGGEGGVGLDLVAGFRELEQRLGAGLGWREWIELVAELAQWEARLGQGGQEGLRDALAGLGRSLHADFADYVRASYPRWLQDASGDRPPLSPDVCAGFLAPPVRADGKALFVLVDCLRLDQWELLRPLITEMFDVEVSYYFSILPTATPFSRNAIFAGLFPAEIAARHPEWWGERDDESLNANEAELLAEQMADVVSPATAVRYEKVATAAEGEELLHKLPGYLAQPGVTALVFNFVDQLTHGRGEHAILFEVARDAAALRSLTRTWFEDSALMRALREAERRNVPVLLTTDHGSIHCNTPATVFAKRDATANLRYKFGEDLRAERPDTALLVEDLPSWGLPKMRLGVRLLLAVGDHFFVYPTKLREYQSRYRGAFLHGGVTPEEMIVPVALLTPRSAR